VGLYQGTQDLFHTRHFGSCRYTKLGHHPSLVNMFKTLFGSFLQVARYPTSGNLPLLTVSESKELNTLDIFDQIDSLQRSYIPPTTNFYGHPTCIPAVQAIQVKASTRALLTRLDLWIQLRTPPARLSGIFRPAKCGRLMC
jgi:hypothetical protein